MKSQASATTLLGGGRREPGSEQSSCQTNSMSAMHDQRRQHDAGRRGRAASREPLDGRPHRRPEGHDLAPSRPAPGTAAAIGRGVGVGCAAITPPS